MRGTVPGRRRLSSLAVTLPALLGACGAGAVDDGPEPEAEVGAEASASVSLPPVAEDAPTRFPVEVDSLWGYIDRSGELVIEPRFARAGPFSEGLAAVVPEGSEKIGFVDTTGAVVIEPRFRSPSHAGLPEFAEGLAAVAPEGSDTYGYIDTTGAMVIEPRFASRAHADPRRFSEGLAAAREAGSEEYGYIDREGSWAIEPRFGGAGPFGGGLAAVRDDGGWRYVDGSGSVVLAGPYGSAGPFREGLAPVEPAGENGIVYIDPGGETVLRPVFPESLPDRARPFSEGLAAVHYGGARYWRYVDRSGEPAEYVRVEEFKWFDRAGPFRGGLARVTVEDADAPVYIDRSGNVVWPPETSSPSAGTAATAAAPAPATCSTRACFQEAFAACEPGESYATSSGPAVARYEILGPEAEGCRVSLEYTSNPNPAWVGRELRFTLDHARPFRTAAEAGMQACLNDPGADCEGPLADLIRG